ncbi:type VII secretion protein EccCa [Arthrobacter crystallopoietes BAB-32]|uniref:Type VII secretion protein EccCa n=1 Tax=Arthrobacter crystallopoietes BAB-32 TaxID=1246476 RepID=N1UPG8_9MICC|nr:type VII secretion protein EccC [Arthrobacter crystallopoietes]EMY32296.1 type VII secretion protein EccCa [Arthrobacter crystallopoietes BAB-32]
MGVTLIHRPARTTAPARSADPFALDAPPPVAERAGGMNMMSLVPLLGAGASMTVMMLFRGSSLAAVGALMMIVTILASIALMISQKGKQARQGREQRERYLEYLERARTELRADEQQAIKVARIASPPPSALFDIIRNPKRLWERRRRNEDFLHVRLGSGERRNREIRVNDSSSSLQQSDTFMTTELEILRQRFESSPELPLTVPLDSAGNVSVVGSREFALAVCRNLLVEAAAFHSPEDLHVALSIPEDRYEDWAWATWLPHLADQSKTHATGPVRRLAPGLDALSDVLKEDLQNRSTIAAEARKNYLKGGVGNSMPRLLVIADTYGAEPQELALADKHAAPGQLGITVIYLVENRGSEPGEVSIRISESGTAPGGFISQNYREDPVDPLTEAGSLDELPPATAEALARELAPLRLSPDSLEHNSSESSLDYLEMLGLSKRLDADDIHRLWQPRGEIDFLRVPLGPDDRGKPAMLDLKEAAQFGMGPHGLCVGATGSGKSEMLRSLVLGLLATHSPEVLAMVLVDFKGGATFAPFEGAPQVTGIITNLSDDLTLIERVYASLNGEILRRQELLKAAGNIANITDYQLHRQERLARGEQMEPLPHLVVIIDEFGELLTARPDFIELFLSIGRIGRSIGVHLLLSSQRIEGGKLRGLDTYLSYRIGLRTLSEAESRTVLDTPDAFHLPPVPGFGYLKVDTTTYTRFKSGYVSGPVDAEEADDEPQDAEPLVLPVPRYAAVLEAPPSSAAAKPKAGLKTKASQRTTGPTVMSTLMDTLRTFPRSVKPIWLPPLPQGIALDTAAGSATATSQGIRLAKGGNLRVPIGLLDDPAKQWQGLWELDLNNAGGNVIIVGGPQSGKSTALRTIVASLALTHSPSEVGIYAVDLLGSSLLPLEGLPHVGGVAVRTNREVVRRTIEEIFAMLAVREQVFERYQIDSLQTLRRMCAKGMIPELASADIVLVLDGYGQLSDEFDDVEKQVQSIISRGGGYGIHVIVTSVRTNEVRIAQQSFFGNRIELRLGDPAESAFGRKLAEGISADRPGRALMDQKLIGHLALPRIDGNPDPDTAAQGMRDLVAAVAASTDDRAMQVRVLPPLVDASAVQVPPRPGRIPLGLRETDLGTEYLDMHSKDRHLVVLGDEGAGKSNLMRSVIRSLSAQHEPEDLVFAVFDPRRGLADEVPEEYLGGYATSPALAEQLAGAVATELDKRVNGNNDGGAADGGKPPRVVLIIDDYDVLTAGGSSPLSRLVPYLPLGPEIGLHAVLSRRVRGASRGMYESFFMSLRDSGSTGLLMSGDRGEGALLNGIRARSLPPGRAQLVQAGKPVNTVQLYYHGTGEDIDEL